MRVLKATRNDAAQDSGAAGGQGRTPGGFHPDVPKPRPATTVEAETETDSEPTADTGNTLIVGPNIKLKGEITACDTLVVEGNIEASMDSRHIQVSESGVFVGEAAVDTAEVAGVFDGSITVRQTLTVRGTGRITGTVRYGRLEVEGGGRIEGDIKLLDKAAARPAERPQTPAPTARAGDGSNAGNGAMPLAAAPAP